MKKAVVLLSGGIDSTVAAYIARKDVGVKGELYAITFNYGQRHSKEIQYAIEVAAALEVEEHQCGLPIFVPGSSSLTGQGEIPTSATLVEEIPSTWVPQRNSIFLALAFAYAETVDASFIYTGFNIRDYSGYPDCRPEFVEQMQRALNLASKQFVETGKGIGIVCPLMQKHKWEIVQYGWYLGIDFSKTWSCYKGDKKACGLCDSCKIRLDAFKKVGLTDPIDYEEGDLRNEEA